MNAISLFSGIGGMDYGLQRSGIRHSLFCESVPYRRDVLRARFPGVPIAEDVRAVGADWHQTGNGRHRHLDTAGTHERAGRGAAERNPGAHTADLVCGGFPCQDLSVAGRRAGLDGDRSGLFFEFARIIDAVRPRWLLVENVPGLLTSNGGRDFGIVLGTLADLGYGLAWRILDSRYFGVPQRRRRVFIVGALADGDPRRAAAERAGQVLAVGQGCDRHPTKGREARPGVAGALAGRSPSRLDDQGTSQLVAHALTAEGHDASEDGGGNDGIGRRSEDDPNLVAYPLACRGRDGGSELEVGEPGVYNALRAGDGGSSRLNQVLTPEGAVRRLTPTECERLQGLPDGWTDLGGTADSKRYAALGDAVTATVAEWIGRRLQAVDRALDQGGKP